MSWHQRAACRDMDPAIFLPGRGESNRLPVEICMGCPVRVPCLEEALAAPGYGDIGVRGGLSARERARLRRRRRAAS